MQRRVSAQIRDVEAKHREGRTFVVDRLYLPASRLDLLDHHLSLVGRDNLVVQTLQQQRRCGDFLGKVDGRPVVVDLRNLGGGASDCDKWRGSAIRVEESEKQKRTKPEKVIALKLVRAVSAKQKW